jgi:predicted secreted protein
MDLPMGLTKIALVLSIVLYLGAPPNAGAAETSSLDLLGFSQDGTYLAFHVTTYEDMAGPFPIRDEVFIVDVARNDFAVSRDLTLRESLPFLNEFEIAPGIDGRCVFERTDPDSPTLQDPQIERVTFTTGSGPDVRDYTVVLETHSAPSALRRCPRLQDTGMAPKIFTMSLHSGGESAILQRDTVLYDSRRCPVAYSVDNIRVYRNRIAVFLNTYSVGLEGFDVGKLVVTGALDETNEAETEPSTGPELTANSGNHWLAVDRPGKTQVFLDVAGNTYAPARAGVILNPSVVGGRIVITGSGHNQDRDGYARTMRVEINGEVIEVLSWLNNGDELSFSRELPTGTLTVGLNRIMAYIHWGNMEYDCGHRVSLTLDIECPLPDEGAM